MINIEGLDVSFSKENWFKNGVEYKIICGDKYVPVIHFNDGTKGQTLEEAILRLKELCQKK